MKKNICIVVLLLCVLGLGGYITYDKVLKDESKKDEKIIKNDEQQMVEKELTEEEKRKIENIKELFQYSFSTSVIPIPTEKLNTDKIELSTKEKINMAFYLAINEFNDNSSNFKDNEDETGESGLYAVELQTFKKIYFNLFDENFSENTLNEENFYIENGYVYGFLPTNYPLSNTDYKLQKILTDNNGKYFIYIDCKDKFDTSKYTSDEISEMLENNYDNYQGKTYYLILEIQKNSNDSYKLISIKYEDK